MTTAVQEKPAETKAKAPDWSPPPLRIDPRHAHVDRHGAVTKALHIWAPAGMAPSDLTEHPDVWAEVQGRRGTSLRQFDQVRVVGHDRSWMAEGVVVDARPDTVILGALKITSLAVAAARFNQLPEVDRYRVAWDAGGYRVQRKGDAKWMTPAVSDLAVAEREMERLVRGGQG